jgi:hypothetical protein
MTYTVVKAYLKTPILSLVRNDIERVGSENSTGTQHIFPTCIIRMLNM